MNKVLWTRFAAVLALLALPALLAAQDHQTKHRRYTLVDLGTFGGPNSGVNGDSVVINDKGTVVGGADTPDWDPICGCPVSHAFRWSKGVLTDLGTLPGGGNFSFAISINSRGAVAGISDNGLVDPITGIEAFVATLWKKNGQVIDLGTFGGSFSLPNEINDRDQAVGGSEDTIPDPFDFGGQVVFGLPSPTQWHATLWKNGTMQDLGTLGGPDSFAYFVNEHDQIAGVSFSDSVPNPTTGLPTVAPFLWENGEMTNLGTLGGVFGTSTGMNKRGQVAGWSNLNGDQVTHAFLWGRGQMQDLGTLGGSVSFGNSINDGGDVIGGSTIANDEAFDAFLFRHGVMTDLGSVAGDGCSNAIGLNSKGQVVGQSFQCGGGASHAFLWENGGPAIDLNAFVPSGSDLVLVEALFVNDRGEIAGAGVLPNGDQHAFVLVPRDKDDDDDTAEDATAATQNEAAPALPSVIHRIPALRMPGALRDRLTRHRGVGPGPSKKSD